MFKKFKYSLLGLLLLHLFPIYAQQDIQEQRMKVVMREVGHEFLMQMNDSVSRVLPIHKEENRYKIQFEKSLDFEPDLLLFSAIKVFKANKLNSNYILEVEQCYTNEVVYSYEFDPKEEDALIACRSRSLPKDCYAFYFTFIEDELEAPAITTSEKNSNKTWLVVLIGGVIMVLVLMFFILKNKKKNKVNHLIRIGKYQFDKHGMKLILDQQTEELSSKEADLLELLVSHPNQTLEREYILNVVWNDEGYYVGRTLDVSISKLRKKLQKDPSLKIINIRGVGYRFTISQ